jgi:hypothetical protein
VEGSSAAGFDPIEEKVVGSLQEIYKEAIEEELKFNVPEI